MSRKRDLSNKRFGRLLAIKNVRKEGVIFWECICDCGETTYVRTGDLTRGNTKSCGCIRVEDLSNKRFGKLLVVKKIKKEKESGARIWECICDCGKKTHVTTNNLNRGNTRSCGCLSSKDLTGERFGKLVVVKEHERENGHRIWECICDCGKTTYVNSNSLKTKNTRSCGCLFDEIALRDWVKKNDLKEGTALSKLGLDKKPPSNNTSGAVGVYLIKTTGKWNASIQLKGKKIHLGNYDKKEDAVKARKEAEERYFAPILKKYERRDEGNQ